MNYINFLLICFQIWCIIKYMKKLKDTDERFKQNEIDYSDLKLKYEKLDTKFENLKLRYIDLENKINDDEEISINDF